MYTGEDVTVGSEVHWYVGGKITTIKKTAASGDVEAAGVVLPKIGEFGSAQVTVNGQPVTCTEYAAATGTGVATETTGVKRVGFSFVLGDEITVTVLEIEDTPLKEVAMCQDVSTSWDITEISQEVHGQVNAVKRTGPISQSADLEKLEYTPEFLSVFLGDLLESTSEYKWSTRHHGAKIVAALVGKKYDTAGGLLKKYIMFECQLTSLDKDFPTADMYTENISVSVGDFMVWEAK